MTFMKAEFVKTAAARVARAFPAYSICPLINNYVRPRYRH